MGLQKIVVLCVILLALGASGWYFMQNNRDADTAPAQNAQETARERTEDPGSFTGFGSIGELMALGESYTCDFRVEYEDGVSEGVVYVDGRMNRYSMRGSYEMGGMQNTFGSIATESTLYWWSETPEGMMGMRMPVEGQGEVSAPSNSPGAAGTISSDEEIAYDCDRWTVDASLFAPPADVEFTDMGEMMNDMRESMPQGMELPEGYERYMQ